MSRYHLVYSTGRGYRRHITFDAADLAEACRRHMTEFRNRRVSHPLVMRLPSGKRHSYFDSQKALLP